MKKNNNSNQPMGVVFNKDAELRRKLCPYLPVWGSQEAAAAAQGSKGCPLTLGRAQGQRGVSSGECSTRGSAAQSDSVG